MVGNMIFDNFLIVLEFLFPCYMGFNGFEPASFLVWFWLFSHYNINPHPRCINFIPVEEWELSMFKACCRKCHFRIYKFHLDKLLSELRRFYLFCLELDKLCSNYEGFGSFSIKQRNLIFEGFALLEVHQWRCDLIFKRVLRVLIILRKEFGIKIDDKSSNGLFSDMKLFYCDLPRRFGPLWDEYSLNFF